MHFGGDARGNDCLQQGHRRGGVPLMRSAENSGRAIGLLLLLLMVLIGPLAQAQPQAQPAATGQNWVDQLSGLQSPPDIDVAALRQEAAARIKTKADAVPLKRPPIAAQLLELPRLVIDIQFHEDTPIVRPDSYGTL